MNSIMNNIFFTGVVMLSKLKKKSKLKEHVALDWTSWSIKTFVSVFYQMHGWQDVSKV